MLVYAVTNPSKLVGSHKKWPGLVLWHGNCPEPITFKRLRRGAYLRALKRAEKNGETVRKEDFIETEELVISPVEGIDDAVIEKRIEEREKELDRQRVEDGLPPMLVEKVLARSPFDAPRNPKRSPRPLCHASSKEDWAWFQEMWRDLTKAYRTASAMFRDGDFSVIFPDHTFRPPLPFAIDPAPAPT